MEAADLPSSGTPQKACDSPSRYEDYSELEELAPRSLLEPVCKDEPFRPVPEEKKMTSLELRELWQKAIPTTDTAA